MKIRFIGFGHLAQAIAQSLRRNPRYHISASSPSLHRGRTPEGIDIYSNNLEELAEAELIILAVKPFTIAKVLEEIAPKLAKNSLVISVAAGINLKVLAAYCAPNQAIIRSMPNIAIAVEKGATPLIANQFVSQQQKEAAQALFECSGIITWVKDEIDIDRFTALTGSGPAYVFLFMEAIIAAAQTLGLEEQVAKEFTVQTFKGALALVSESSKEIADLRKQVTSPGGTTAAALECFQDKEFDKLIACALKAAFERAKQLGKAGIIK